jgi:hypothetical protein
MLEYKGAHAGIVVREVNERFSTQTCSECGSISGPKGVAGLGIRAWICPDCGAERQRDINAAKNILRRGRAPLAVGIPCLKAGEDVKKPQFSFTLQKFRWVQAFRRCGHEPIRPHPSGPISHAGMASFA